MAYEDIVLATSGLVNYWKLGEASGTSIADSRGADTGTIQGGVTLGQAGLPGSALTAALFDGSTGYISTANQIASPGPVAPFSLELWFKMTNKTGIMVSFTAPQTGAVTNSSPMMYPGSGDGKVYAGTNPAAAVAVNTVNAYNDGLWHHAVFSVAANNNLSLVVDGLPAVTNPTTQAPSNFAGYWRIGSGGSSGWPFVGATTFSGALAHVAVYNTVLSQATISQHYVAGRNYTIKTGSPLPTVRGVYPWGGTDGGARPSTGQMWPRGTKF